MKIFGIGTVVIDHVVVLPNYPHADTKSAIQSHWRQIGGPVPVALSVATFYGAETRFWGRWGNDAAGREIQAGLENRGIDISASQSRDEWETGFAQVWTVANSGSRTIAFHRGSFPTAAQCDETDRPAPDDCQILHVDGAMPEESLAAAQAMKKQDGLVVLDAGSKKPGMEHLLPLVDVLVASDLFCKSWFGDAEVPIEALHRLGPDRVIRTLAGHGAVFSDGHQMFKSAALKIQPIDTNGAGDIFCGAVLYSLTQQWDPAKSLDFANFVAGSACLHFGNTTYPAMDQFRNG